MKQPPHLAQKLLKWYAGKADLEDIHGDLDEVYEIKRTIKGRLSADINYWTQVISLLFSYGLKKRKKGASYSTHYSKNSIAMFKNYLKIALRNLKKQKTFTAINVMGLSIGMSIALLAVAMYVDLIQFDTWHNDAEDVYRVVTEVKYAGNKERYSSSPPALTYKMDEEMPGIYKSVHIDESFSALIDHNGNNLRVHGYYSEPSFFDLFAFKLESGTPAVLHEPDQVIITKELATKLFGDEPALNKILETEEWGQLQIAGVLEAFPKRTHLSFDILTSFNTSPQFNSTFRSSEWVNGHSSYYYFAVESDKKNTLIQQINDLGKEGESEFLKEDKLVTYDLQALLDITPGEMINDGIGVQFDMPTMFVFIGISLLILVPACFNYTNMSIALALKRSKEVGIRKVMGSHKKHIINQFLVETVIICLGSVILTGIIFYQMRMGFSRVGLSENVQLALD
ncbi:MAG: ABC transporter permease [Bacteroidota bacterium]